jgi:NlpC/P60 family putative phage cell wall peptidase
MSARVLAEARRWIGTPYVHQASVLGVGCDCLGLVRGVWRAVIGPEPEPLPAYSPDWAEARRDEVLMQALRRWLQPLEPGAPADGEVVLMRVRQASVAKHVGIVADGGAAFVHAYSGHGVVESALSVPWRRRIAARFAFPEM